MMLGLARAREGTGQTVAPLLDEAQEQLEAALAELRDLSHGILPPILRERGLEPALRELVKRLPARVECELPGLARLPLDQEAALYFVASESLTNAIKHASPGSVSLALSRDETWVRLRVADDGVGGADPSGSGLQGLADRMGALGGELEVRPGEERGTVVEAWVPCGSS